MHVLLNNKHVQDAATPPDPPSPRRSFLRTVLVLVPKNVLRSWEEELRKVGRPVARRVFCGWDEAFLRREGGGEVGEEGGWMQGLLREFHVRPVFAGPAAFARPLSTGEAKNRCPWMMTSEFVDISWRRDQDNGCVLISRYNRDLLFPGLLCISLWLGAHSLANRHSTRENRFRCLLPVR